MDRNDIVNNGTHETHSLDELKNMNIDTNIQKCNFETNSPITLEMLDLIPEILISSNNNELVIFDGAKRIDAMIKGKIPLNTMIRCIKFNMPM